MVADEIDCHEPLLKGDFRVLKDCPNKARKTFVAVSTLELIISVGASINVNRTTERAHYHLSPTLLGDKITATLLTVEVIDKRDKRIEMLKFKFHSR